MLMKRGATDYLVKPVSRDDLLMILRSAVRRHETVQRGSF
jgi:FixJ family two-component response regulator